RRRNAFYCDCDPGRPQVGYQGPAQVGFGGLRRLVMTLRAAGFHTPIGEVSTSESHAVFVFS
ncbi:MAG TPA: hypothetical protein VIK24_20295, partial [Pyrinomonadaceae bacterium]